MQMFCRQELGMELGSLRAGTPLCLGHFRTGATPRRERVNLRSMACSNSRKSVWVWTKNKDVMTASVEAGWNTFIFTPEDEQLLKEWTSLARIDPLLLKDKQFLNVNNKRVGILECISSGDEMEELKSLDGQSEVVVMDALDWQVIPAEAMVAAFQGSNASAFAMAKTSIAAKTFFEALEKGVDGVVLDTQNPEEVFALKAYIGSRKESHTDLTEATVTRIENVGMGDRVCVDLCSLLTPGEGLLVGSFARGLFLVHSECLKSDYIESRPFRVNAGPVHAYLAMPNGRTTYLSELCSGTEVLVVNANGQTRPATVGRVKVESRSLVLIEAEVPSQRNCSILLQNAETVSLVSPYVAGKERPSAIPVSKLQMGSKVLVSIQASARHTGLQIQEFIVEK